VPGWRPPLESTTILRDLEAMSTTSTHRISGTTKGAAWLGRLCLAVGSLAFQACGPGSERIAVESFYQAVARGDVEGARRLHTSASASDDVWPRAIEHSTRAGTLDRVELIELDVWSESGAHARVRKHFADGSTEDVALELERHRGEWQIATALDAL
jgi:hypothetical protein